MNKNKGGFFAEEDLIPWKREWQGMPEYSSNDLTPYQSTTLSFETAEDVKRFTELMIKHNSMRNRVINKNTTTIKISFSQEPEEQRLFFQGRRYACKKAPYLLPKYPIYIISKGRWESRLTSKALERMEVPYHIVVEPQERKHYEAVIEPHKILTLPFSNLGQGSIPARNWVWDHAMSLGVQRHWIMDDNISEFFRLNNNTKIPTQYGVLFRVAEDFVDRYMNIALAGFQYEFFAPAKQVRSPYVLNTRIYSCILIWNKLSHRWRGRYNEDTDLSLRVLKDGWCTILFNAFLCKKIATMRMKGGNTEELYNPTMDGRLKMAQSLVEQHPDVTSIEKRWGRFQHVVDYSQFKKNKLKKKQGVQIPNTIDEYSMKLQDLVEKRTVFTYSDSTERIWISRDNPVRRYMKNTSRTMDKLAKEFGVTQQDISNWIHEKVPIPKTVREYISKKEGGG